MTEEISKIDGVDVKRRALIKGAAWSVPVIAVAAAAPLAAASVTGASVVWQNPTTDLLNLTLLDGRAVAAAGVLPSGPTYFTINNPTPGAIEGPITGQITVTRSGGLPVLAAKGYGVKSISGGTITSYNESVNSWTLGSTIDTTQTFQLAGGVSGTSLNVPVEFALTNSGALGVGLLVTFAVSLTLHDKDNVQIGSAATSSLTLPVGLNVL